MCIETMCCGEVGQSVQNGKGQRVTGTSVSQRPLHGKAVGIEWARTGVGGPGKDGTGSRALYLKCLYNRLIDWFH